MINYNSKTEIIAYLQSHSLHMTKKFGQNFLLDPKGRERILTAFNPQSDENIWEIGPGLGAMTADLISRTKSVTVFEIDRGFIKVLEELFGNVDSFRIVPGDFVKTWREHWNPPPDGILGNLPYNCASAIIGSLIENRCIPGKAVFTVQKEMAERMTAKPGTKDYSSFSVLCQSSFSIEHCGNIGAGAFFPAPDVISSVVSMKPLDEPPAVADWNLFFTVSSVIFSSRRKTILNNLKKGLVQRGFSGMSGEEIRAKLESIGISPSERGENLSVKKIAELASALAF